LLEIVSEPDIFSAEQARAYVTELRATLLALGVSDVKMEEGSMRVDANVSVRPAGTSELGTRTEIKNMNSIRSVQRAIEYEIERQIEGLEAGERVVQETRHWNEADGRTRSMRSKEEAYDYRYFPEPDLVPLRIDPRWVDEIRAGLPELPRARRQRFVAQYGLPGYDADVLTQSRALGDYYEAVLREPAASAGADRPKIVSNWVMSELLRVLPGDDERAIATSPIPPRHLAGLLRLIDDGTISGRIAKDVFQKMFDSREDATTIVGREGLTQVADEAALGAIVDSVMAANPKAIDDFKRGKIVAKKSLVGQVMKATGGKANPTLVDRLLEDKLSKIQR
jgi:aspartyl-tRNA(Asn)/glutamyl-tRNA(Gln) amidotransferase subunit B